MTPVKQEHMSNTPIEMYSLVDFVYVDIPDRWCNESVPMRTLRYMEQRYEYDVDFWSIFRDPEVRNKWFEMNEKLSGYR